MASINPFSGKIEQTTPPLRFNPLAGAFQFSGGSNRVVFDPVSGGFSFAGVSDPLAGIDFALRLEKGKGLFQDAACTIPVTEDFQLVKGWKDVLSGSNKIIPQTMDSLSPLASGGRLLFDGIDDFLINMDGSWGLTQSMLIYAYRPTNLQYTVADPGVSGSAWTRFNGDGAGYWGYFSTLRKEGYPAAVPNINSVHTVQSTVTTYEGFINGTSQGIQAPGPYSPGGGLRIGISWDSGTAYFGGEVSCVFITDDFSARERIEAYAATLNA